MQNKRGERESPWKIPHFMRIPLAVKSPLEWERVSLVSHSVKDILRNLINKGETLTVSKNLKIPECETLSKAFCSLSKQYSGASVSFWHFLVSFY